MPIGEAETFDLREIILANTHLLSNADQLEIESNLPNSEIWVRADKGQLSGAIQNLIRNSIQAIPPDRKGEISITADFIADKIRVRVWDNGTGIPPEAQEKLFMPNFTTKSTGMGMGLAIVKTTVEYWGGTISYQTEWGKGSEFIFLLPKTPAPKAA
jgi:signal transduction histidine kinase